MILTFKYRLLPTKAQHRALAEICEGQRLLYNAALQERIDCYRNTGRTITLAAQSRSLSEWRRDDPDARAVMRSIQEWTLTRLDDAYAAFFRRLKHGGKPGFPRFRSIGRWRAFGISDCRDLAWRGGRLRIKGIPGTLRVHLHRPLPENGAIKQCIFRRDQKGWAVCFQVATPNAEPRAAADAVGLDLGLKVFAYLSDGSAIPTPHIARRAERETRRRQRALARCKRDSRRRQKVKARLLRQHVEIANERRTWLHQQSALIARTYGLVAAEDLNVSGMLRNHYLARSVSDASWSTFLSMVAYKVERTGGRFVTVNPRNTSQRCSGCGELVPKSLAVRTHACPSCGLVIDRDWNAARNILQAVAGLGQPNVAHWGERAARNLVAIASERLPRGAK